MNPPAVLDKIDRFAEQLGEYLRHAPHLAAYGRLRSGEGVDRVLDLEAARTWEQVLKENPREAIALHHVAVIHHGRAIEAERAGKGDLQELQRLWVRALRCWSELWRCDEFWQGVVEDWHARKSEADARADLFDEAQWRAFRQRMPEHILSGHLEAARQAILTDTPRARMYLQVVKNSGFDPADQDRVRASLYAPFRPDEALVERQQTFVEALDRIGKYMELDGDYTEAMRNAVAIAGQWLLAAANGKIDVGRTQARLKQAAGQAQALAAGAGLRKLAKDNSAASQEIAAFFLALGDYHFDKAKKAWKAEDTAQAIRDLDESWQAMQQAIPFEKCTVRARPEFFMLLSQAVDVRLGQCQNASGSEFARAEELVRLGLSVEADEPHMLMHQAQIEGLKGNTPKFQDLMRRAKQQAQDRDNPDLVARIEQAHSQGPNQAQGVQLLKKGVEALKRKAFREAIQHLKAALDLCPDDPVIEAHLGQAYYNTGQMDAGLALLRSSKLHARKRGDRQLEQQIDQVLVLMGG